MMFRCTKCSSRSRPLHAGKVVGSNPTSHNDSIFAFFAFFRRFFRSKQFTGYGLSPTAVG